MQRDQRGRASGLHVDARSAQIQLVGDPRAQVILVVTDMFTASGRTEQRRIDVRFRCHVAAHRRSAAGEHADRAVVRFAAVAGPFERFPGALQEQAVLGIGDHRLARRHAEELRIKQLDLVECGSGGHVIGTTKEVGRHTGREQFFGGEEANRLDAVDQVLPELIQVASARESPRHSDDRDRMPALGNWHISRGRVVQSVAFHDGHRIRDRLFRVGLLRGRLLRGRWLRDQAFACGGARFLAYCSSE